MSSHLRAISVGNDEAMTISNQADDGRRCAPCIAHLLGNSPLLTRPDERVAANGDEDG